MKDMIIVTVLFQHNGDTEMYDLEIPTDTRIDKLTNNIADVLNAEIMNGREPLGYMHANAIDPVNSSLYCKRLGRDLRSDLLLREEQIWTGDILIIRGRSTYVG